MTLDELQLLVGEPRLEPCRSVDCYAKLNRIEEGTYGVVFRAQDKSSGEIVALKRLKLEKEREGFPVTSLREINAMMHAAPNHPHIVRLRELVVGRDLASVFIVMDFVEHDLRGLMDDMATPFSLSEVKTLMMQLLSAVAAMHRRWIVHRDLKTSNLLLSNKGEIKVADFGLARKLSIPPSEQLSPMVVTLWYRAPELLLGQTTYDWSIDMWSIGCIFGELLTGRPILPGKGEIDQIDRIFRLLGIPSETSWPRFSSLPHAAKIKLPGPQPHLLRSTFPSLSQAGFDMMRSLLAYDPERRINAESALKHVFFAESPLPKDPAAFPTWPSRACKERSLHETPDTH